MLGWMRAEWGCEDGYDYSYAWLPQAPALPQLELRFTTAWSAPLPIFLVLSRLGAVSAEWYEEYGQHAGRLLFAREEGEMVCTEVKRFTCYGDPSRYPSGSSGLSDPKEHVELLTELRTRLWGADDSVPLCGSQLR
jgi:hypothetical protein